MPLVSDSQVLSLLPFFIYFYFIYVIFIYHILLLPSSQGWVWSLHLRLPPLLSWKSVCPAPASPLLLPSERPSLFLHTQSHRTCGYCVLLGDGEVKRRVWELQGNMICIEGFFLKNDGGEAARGSVR